jgi:flagellar biosynthesis protein FliP
MTERMKVLDLKLKEIKAVDNKVFSIKGGNFKRKLKKIVSRSKKLKLSLNKEKKLVAKILKKVTKKQKKILRVLSVFDKDFTEKNHVSLNKMLTAINLSLKTYMKYPFFKKAYHQFITYFLKKVREFSIKHFQSPETTAQNFVKKHWNKFFQKEQKAHRKNENEVLAKKHNEKRKKSIKK